MPNIGGEHSVRKPAGTVIVTEEMGIVHTADTLQCCHCGMHWQVRRGSRSDRGFCMKCMKVTCGQKKCDPCYPMEKQLDDAPKGKGPLALPWTKDGVLDRVPL